MYVYEYIICVCIQGFAIGEGGGGVIGQKVNVDPVKLMLD